MPCLRAVGTAWRPWSQLRSYSSDCSKLVKHPPICYRPVSPVAHRFPSPCRALLDPVAKKPCFDSRNVKIVIGNLSHGKLIRSFLYTHQWPRDPSVTGLWMALDSDYLQILTEKYAFSGDRFLAFEREQRTGETKLIGVCCAYKVFPWTADEIEEWAHYTVSRPERHRMYFTAHCLRGPDLFKKYKAPYIYDIELITTASEVSGQGVATKLINAVLTQSRELRHPVVQVIAYSSYVSKICQKLGLQQEWSVRYDEFIDDAGQAVFYPRAPHIKVAVYSRPFSCAVGSWEPCKPPW